jgi:hypothetical protein
VALAATVSGCGLFSSSNDGGNSGGGDAGQADLVMGPDMANVTVTVHWNLIGENIQGGNNNGFPMKCDDPTLMATSLTIVAKTDSGLTSMQTVPCPAGESTGVFEMAPPDLVGPYTFTGSVDGKPMSASQHVHNVTLMSGVTIAIYAMGCDLPECLM